MALIRPFRGVRYNEQKIKDIVDVICPPYDVISPTLQDQLYARDSHNFVHIEYNRETAQDNDRDNRYTRAANTVSSWLQEGILKVDRDAAFYLHVHHFKYRDRPLERHDLITCTRLEEWEAKIIRPHEQIIPKAKSDRMSMLAACHANTSAVLAMYRDPAGVVADNLHATGKEPPLIDFTDTNGERHQFWMVTDPDRINAIQGAIAKQPLYIADGHHRYDSALTYRRELLRTVRASGEEGFNFVMMSLIDFDDPGTVILATHRLVRGIPKILLPELKLRLLDYFEIEERSIDSSGEWLDIEDLLAGQSPVKGQSRLAVYGLNENRVLILTLRADGAADLLLPADRSRKYRALAVSLVDHVILEGQLGYNKETENLMVDYTRDSVEAVARVRSGEFQLALMTRPVAPETIQDIADAGDRMPRKSTYFYPKLPAGLVFYRW